MSTHMSARIFWRATASVRAAVQRARLRRATRELEQAPLTATEKRLELAQVLTRTGDLRGALELLSGANEAPAAAVERASVLLALGRVFEAEEIASRVLQYATLEDVRLGVAPRLILASSAALRGNTSAACEQLAAAQSLADLHLMGQERAAIAMTEGATHLMSEDYEVAHTHLERAVQLSASLGLPQFCQLEARLEYAEACVGEPDLVTAQGRVSLADATKFCAWGNEVVDLGGPLAFLGGRAHRLLGLLKLNAGRFGAAQKHFGIALQLLANQGREVDWAHTLLVASAATAEGSLSGALEWAQMARKTSAERGWKALVDRANKLLASFGTSAAVGQTEVDPRVRSVQALLDVSQHLSQSTSLDALLARIIAATLELLGLKRGIVLLRESANGPLSFRVGQLSSGEAIAQESWLGAAPLVGVAESTGQPAVASSGDTGSSARRTEVCSPLRHGDEILGFLCLDGPWLRNIEPTELHMLESFSAQGAIALVNARRFSQVQALRGDLETQVNARTQALASSNQKLAASMRIIETTSLLEAETRSAALHKEFEVARKIQLTTVPPTELIELPVARFIGKIVPASLCGGDFWTYLHDAHRLLFFTGDVTGHGLGPAIITSRVKSCLETLWRTDSSMSPEALLRLAHATVEASSSGAFEMTAVMVEVDTESQRLTTVCAGHSSPLMLRLTGKPRVDALDTGGSPLGTNGAFEPSTSQTAYTSGDLLVLYTDGLIEAENPARVQFGRGRFQRILLTAKPTDPTSVLNSLFATLNLFAAERPLDDDVTVIVVELC